MIRPVRKQCPECRVTLTRYEWSRLWWVSAGLSGRLVQPCSECGALLRLSAMRVLSGLGALGLIGTSALMFLQFPPSLTFVLALVCALVMLGGVLGTRVEAAPGQHVGTLPGHPEADIAPARR